MSPEESLSYRDSTVVVVVIFSVELEIVLLVLVSLSSRYSVYTGSVERVVVTVVCELDLLGLDSSILSSSDSGTRYLASVNVVAVVLSLERGLGLGELLLSVRVASVVCGCSDNVSIVILTFLSPEVDVILLLLGIG